MCYPSLENLTQLNKLQSADRKLKDLCTLTQTNLTYQIQLARTLM